MHPMLSALMHKVAKLMASFNKLIASSPFAIIDSEGTLTFSNLISAHV